MHQDDRGEDRATLYKYFPDVEAILAAWHQRNIARHLAQLTETAAQPGTPGQRLQAVLKAYAAQISHRSRHHGTELAALVHRGEHMAAAQQQLRDFLAGLLAEAAKAGDVRDDMDPGELAGYSCTHSPPSAPCPQPARLVHCYLGMPDTRLPMPVAGLVRAEEVRQYPTNFRSMPQLDLDAISLRGEQLTRTLLAHYLPAL